MGFRPGFFAKAGGQVRALPLPPTFMLVLPVLRRLGLAQIVDRECRIRRDALMTHGQVVEAMVLHMLAGPPAGAAVQDAGVDRAT